MTAPLPAAPYAAAPYAAAPYALSAVPFSFPALASLAARTMIGGERETVLACFILARLATGLLPPVTLVSEVLRERADRATLWFASQLVDQRLRAHMLRVISATATGDRAQVATELESLRIAVAPGLDSHATSELLRLVGRLREQG